MSFPYIGTSSSSSRFSPSWSYVLASSSWFISIVVFFWGFIFLGLPGFLSVEDGDFFWPQRLGVQGFVWWVPVWKTSVVMFLCLQYSGGRFICYICIYNGDITAFDMSELADYVDGWWISSASVHYTLSWLHKLNIQNELI